MSGTTPNDETVSMPVAQEVQANFSNDAALQDAVEQLSVAGYKRADFNLPEDQPDPALDKPHKGAENPTDNTDTQQLRTMGSSMAATVGAFAFAGVTIATGGVVGVASIGAAAIGAGIAAAVSGPGAAAKGVANRAGVAERDQRGAEGWLLFAVRTRDDEQVKEVMAIVRTAGATNVRLVGPSDEMSMTAGVSAASWTGD